LTRVNNLSIIPIQKQTNDIKRERDEEKMRLEVL
jgi:hypothetical protein